MPTNKHILTTFLLFGSLSAFNLGDFAGYWEGVESLSSPTMSYEGRATYLSLRHNASLDENLLYNSNSDFIYNGYLDWAAHYFTYNKAENQVSFGRRFTTPLGILGTQDITYDIIENDGSRIYLEFMSEDGLTTHSLNISLSMLNVPTVQNPEDFRLEPNFPNPFNPSTSIPVSLSVNGDTRVSVYDARGSLVKNIHRGFLHSGHYVFSWDGTNDQNLDVSAGIYFCKLFIGANTKSVRKMILLK